MPTKYLMTWNAKQKRWSKKYKNKQYFRSCKQLGAPPTKEGSRVAANAWWEAKRLEIDSKDKGVEAYEHAIAVRKLLLANDNYFIPPEDRDNLPAEIATLERELERGRVRHLTNYERDPLQYWDNVRRRTLIEVMSAV